MLHGLNPSDSILGEGIIWPIPPDLSSCGASCRSSQCGESNIDWDGEVRCRSDVTVSGFNAANVQVKVGFLRLLRVFNISMLFPRILLF